VPEFFQVDDDAWQTLGHAPTLADHGSGVKDGRRRRPARRRQASKYMQNS
jgi:hypothetical protein